MPTKNLLITILTFSLLIITNSAYAQRNQKEGIMDFHSDIKIEVDGKIIVTETIIVNTTLNDIRRGIVRSIPNYRTDAKGKKQKMDFTIISVHRNENIEKWNTETVNEHKEIYIGDSNVMLTRGKHTYVIVYESYGHIGFFDTFDELYWNVTGNDWAFSIGKASATITLPDGATSINTSCYTGRKGSTASECSVVSNENTVTFRSKGALSPGEGLTVAVSFQRDIIKRPPPPTWAEMFWEEHKIPICALAFFTIMACFCYFTWRKVGKDPEKHVVIPTFNPPHDWSAAVTRYLYKRKYDSKVFTSTLISMAVKGALQIKLINRKFYLERKGINTRLSLEEKSVYDILFHQRESITVSDKHHETFSSANSGLSASIKARWKIDHYFRYNRKYIFLASLLMIVLLISYTTITGEGETAMAFLLGIPFAIFGIALLVKAIKKGKVGCSTIILFLIGLSFLTSLFVTTIGILATENIITAIFLISMFVLAITYFFLIKAPTELGAQIEAELEGFRMYLKTAEENRLNLMTPPDRTPELFEQLLPYAIALDVENEWGKKFDDVLKQADYKPDWYNDTMPLRYSILAGSLASSLESSIVLAQIDPTAVSSGSSGSGGWSSGSSGGGFSGGGGGGGGGRGW